MSKSIDDHVLPRPVERLPEYAHAKARQTLADKIIDAFGLTNESASAIANAVVDPSEVRKTIQDPNDPDVEKIPVPGGILLGIRTSVWSRRTMPDPRNPRILPSRRHPFAVDPGTGGEDSKFRPVPEPQSLDPDKPHRAELAVGIESRDHLTWATQQAKSYVLAENNWCTSIESQGVMEAVWLVPTTYRHADGTAPATTLTTVEGSSRDTAVHEILGVRSADVPYDDDDGKLRNSFRKLNLAYDRGGADRQTMIAMRCERIPALILVGFRPHAGGTTGFSTAVKSLVALRHVDPPKPWGEGPENELLADEVLDELYRRDLISATQRAYYAGSCTKREAQAAHLPADPVLRASQIVQLFSDKDDRVDEAIKVAVTSQSTRKRITPKLKNELATALILRAVSDERDKVDQVRRYLRHAFSKSVRRADWKPTGRSTEQLVDAALEEVRSAVGSGNSVEGEPGPASLELAIRASYPLVVSGRLNADRGTANNDQPDRRTPGEVLDAMRRSPHGVLQLSRALQDFAANLPIRAVEEDGTVKRWTDGSGEQTVNDIFLRTEFPAPGATKALRSGDTPSDRYDNALNAFGAALQALDRAFDVLTEVVGDNGQKLVDSRGVEPRLVEPWREFLKQVDEGMLVWSFTYRRMYGTKAGSLLERARAVNLEEPDPYAASNSEVEEDWDRSDAAATAE